jgi:hypothetical protein
MRGRASAAWGGPGWPPPRRSQAELEAVAQALAKGPQAFGFDTDLWTLGRIAAVIERLTGVRYHPGHRVAAAAPVALEPAATRPPGQRA